MTDNMICDDDKVHSKDKNQDTWPTAQVQETQ